MKKIFAFLSILCISLTIFGQNFEGEIIYKNSFISKSAAITDEQLNSMMGVKTEYYIKGANYKSISNGTLLQWQLYMPGDNKLYTKMANSEAAFWNDGSVNTDSVIKSEINKGVTEILGYKCDELILTCVSGIQKYYFNPKIGMDKKFYTNHKFGNWYDYLSKTNALPLKMIIENAQFIIETVATEVKPMKLDNTFFQLPPDIKTAKSPY